jgi:ABC-2 type transport system ATP-binding protein
MLLIKNLLKKYGDKTILDIEELFIPQGITHLKGINGSGKTTFSKIVAGLVPYRGEVTLLESYSPVTTKVAYRKQVNYAESEPLYPEFFTANDLIRFVGKAKGASKNDQNSIAENFGVNEYLHDTIGTYSSGMLKRLSLSLAFLGSPTLILLDEPFNTLDTSAIDMLRNLIHDHQKEGVNFILVSHQDIAQLGVEIDAAFLVKDHNITPN